MENYRDIITNIRKLEMFTFIRTANKEKQNSSN